jgi:hypothetical protein
LLNRETLLNTFKFKDLLESRVLVVLTAPEANVESKVLSARKANVVT